MSDPMPWNSVDIGAVAPAGLLSLLATAIAVPLWRRFLATQKTEAEKSHGESGWMKRQSDELNRQDQLIRELLKLRQLDAEVIASLRLEKALAAERTERLLARMKRMEEVLCEMRPDFAKWIRSDFTEIGPAVFDPPVIKD